MKYASSAASSSQPLYLSASSAVRSLRTHPRTHTFRIKRERATYRPHREARPPRRAACVVAVRGEEDVATHDVLVMAQNCAMSARLSRLSLPPPNISAACCASSPSTGATDGGSFLSRGGLEGRLAVGEPG